MARFYQAPGWTRNDSYELSELYIIRPTNGIFSDGLTLWELVVCAACVAGSFVLLRLGCMAILAIYGR